MRVTTVELAAITPLFLKQLTTVSFVTQSRASDSFKEIYWFGYFRSCTISFVNFGKHKTHQELPKMNFEILDNS